MSKPSFNHTTRKPDDLIPYANNSRVHSPEQVTEIASSITEFGFTIPVLIDTDNGIIAGHGRIEAAKKIGLDEVPCIVADGWTEAQKKAYIIADNRLPMNATWDEEMLGNELRRIEEMGTVDMSVMGFTPDELENYMNEIDEQPTEGLTDEDDVPEAPTFPITQHGDVWTLGDHTLMCGDSTIEDDVKALVKKAQGKRVHCISDPPYGIAYDPKQDKYGMIKNDDTFLDYVGLAKKHTDGFFFMWTGYQVVDEWMRRTKEAFEKINNIIIWHKGGGGMGDCIRTLAQDYEIALVCNRGNPIRSRRIGSMWDDETQAKKEWAAKANKKELQEVMTAILAGETVWKIGKDNTATYLHPTQKPVSVNQKALECFTMKGETVVDLFLGSGSNLIACETMGRQCLGMELDPIYCDIIIKRWQEFTGQQAVNEATGRTYNESVEDRNGEEE